MCKSYKNHRLTYFREIEFSTVYILAHNSKEWVFEKSIISLTTINITTQYLDYMRESVNNNINEINSTIVNNNNNINIKMDAMQALHDASRMELLEKIELKSRLSSRASARAPSRTIVTSARTVLLYVLFCLTHMYCTYRHTLYIPCFPVLLITIDYSSLLWVRQRFSHFTLLTSDSLHLTL